MYNHDHIQFLQSGYKTFIDEEKNNTCLETFKLFKLIVNHGVKTFVKELNNNKFFIKEL